MRRIVTALLRLVVTIFYRRIEVVGREHVPAAGPAIFVLNHPNALVDPVFILCFAGRRVAFLAKAPIFRMPFVGFLARSLDSLPVYRKQDEGSDPDQNRETFERARALLQRGGTIAIFPEGTSHSDPQLRPLKTGAARIALGAAAESRGSLPEPPPGGKGVQDAEDDFRLLIVPAGLYYTAKQTFRSAALLRFGEPIAVERTALDERGEPPADAVRALSERIERALREVTLNAGEAEALDLVARAERIFSSGAPADLAGELERRRRFVAGYAFHRQRSPARLAAVAAQIERLECALAETHLEPRNLTREAFRGGAVLRYAAAHLLFFVLALPGALAGALVHYPAYRLAGALATRLSRSDEDVVSTIKVLAAMLFFPLSWAAVALAAGLALGPRAGLAALLVAPAGGYIAVRFVERLDRFAAAARALATFVTRRDMVERLVEERDTIRREIEALGAEAETSKAT